MTKDPMKLYWEAGVGLKEQICRLPGAQRRLCQVDVVLRGLEVAGAVLAAPLRVGPRGHPLDPAAVLDGGHAGDGAEALAGLPLHHVLAALVVAVVGQRDGQRRRVVLL